MPAETTPATALDVLAIFVSLLAACLSLAALLLTWMWRSRFSRSQQIGNIPRLLMDEYLRKSYEHEGVTTGFASERLYAKKHAALCNPGTCSPKSKETQWCEFHQKSIIKEPPTRENRFCYELSRSLQTVGLMVFTGARRTDRTSPARC